MATYVMLIEARGAVSAGILYSNVEGAKQQADTIALFKGKVVAQYIVLGRYDEVLIVDFPDDESALAFNLRLNAEGAYGESMRAFLPEEVKRATEYVQIIDSANESHEQSEDVSRKGENDEQT